MEKKEIISYLLALFSHYFQLIETLNLIDFLLLCFLIIPIVITMSLKNTTSFFTRLLLIAVLAVPVYFIPTYLSPPWGYLILSGFILIYLLIIYFRYWEKENFLRDFKKRIERFFKLVDLLKPVSDKPIKIILTEPGMFSTDIDTIQKEILSNVYPFEVPFDYIFTAWLNLFDPNNKNYTLGDLLVVNAFALKRSKEDPYIIAVPPSVFFLPVDAQLFILGHELGHHMLNHTLVTFWDKVLSIFQDIISPVISIFTFGIPYAIGYIAAKTLLELKFTREEEFDADMIGAEILKGMGFIYTPGVRKLFDYFDWLEQASKKGLLGQILENIFSDHPPAPKRYTKIARFMRE